MNAITLDRDGLKHLRRMRNVYLPGNLLAGTGIPALFIVPMLLLCLISPFLAANKPDKQPNAVQPKNKPNAVQPKNKPDNTESGSFGGLCMAFIGLLQIVGTATILLTRHKLNTAFIKKHTINLHYSLSQQDRSVYNRLLRHLDDLSSNIMFEIMHEGKSEYKQGLNVKLRMELPKYLSSNMDVYCLMIGHDKSNFSTTYCQTVC